MPRPSDPLARSRLLSAAEAVFLERGLDRAKVEDITQAAGLSKGAFYLHFKSKEAAFREILSKALGGISRDLDELSASRSTWEGKSPLELIAFWHSHDLALFEYIWERRALMRLVLQGGGSPDYAHLTELFVQRAESLLGMFVDYGTGAGYFHADYEKTSISTFMAGGWDRIARRVVLDLDRSDLPRWIAQAQCFCLRSLATPAFMATANAFYSNLRRAESASLSQPASQPASAHFPTGPAHEPASP